MAKILVAILLFSPVFALVPPEKSTHVLQEVSQAKADYYIAAMGSPYQRVLNVAERYRVVMLDPGVFEQAVSSSQRYTRLADWQIGRFDDRERRYVFAWLQDFCQHERAVR